MLHIIHEQSVSWPTSGPVKVTTPAVELILDTSPVVAQRHADSYLGNHVGMAFLANSPRLLMGDEPRWRFDVDLHLPSCGKVATLGQIDVIISNIEVVKLVDDEIERIQNFADAIASSLVPVPA